MDERDVAIPAVPVHLAGTLTLPVPARGVVAFAHGSGSSRFSPRNRAVAGVLNRAGFATLLLDLLTVEEERVDAYTAHLRFNIDLLAQRLGAATEWIAREAVTAHLPVGYFGASTGAAAALLAAAHLATDWFRRYTARAEAAA